MQQEIRHACDPADVVRLYVAAWGEADDAKRLQILAACYEETARYSDPTISLDGREALSTYLADLQRRFPGSRVTQEGELDAYGSHARFGWYWSPADGTVRRRGVDFARFSAAGRLQEVVGFFDPA